MTGLDIAVSVERPEDSGAIRLLEERAFGPGRFARSAYRLREGNPHDPSLSFVARISTLVVGSVRLSRIRVGRTPALLLGPLIVDPAFRGKGIGGRLIEAATAAGRAGGHRLVLLVGDEPYYGRMGFSRLPPGRVAMPGPVDPLRLLALPLAEGALDGLSGDVRPG